jgi:hypothetical protein
MGEVAGSILRAFTGRFNRLFAIFPDFVFGFPRLEKPIFRFK